jgi:hypothetical protein
MKTNNRQRTGIIPGKKRGGQPCNRNAAKPVHSLSAVQAKVRDFKRRARAAIRMADGLCGRHPSTGSG